MGCLGRAPLRFTPGFPGGTRLAFSHPRSPEVSGRHGAPITGPGLGVGRQEGGRKDRNPLERSGVKCLPPRPLTATTNQESLPRGPFNNSISFKNKNKILIWSFFCFQSGQGEKERDGGKAPPTPECAGATWQCHQRPLSSYDPEKKYLWTNQATPGVSPAKGLPPCSGAGRSERLIFRGGFPVTSSGTGQLPPPHFS